MLAKNKEYGKINTENLFAFKGGKMFAYIKGELVLKTNNYVIIDVSGIGYKIFMPLKAIQEIGEIKDVVKVHTYYCVREDSISLYGFNTNEELRMFELLLSVSGIGAKSATTMLSEISPSSFALAIISNDTHKLTKIPGIGAKTAARIVLELKDKLKSEEAINKNEIEIKEAIYDDEKVQEAIMALQVLGYTKKDIESVIKKIDVKNLEIEDIIKKGLLFLGK